MKSQVNMTDRIKPDGMSIVSYLEDLQRGNYQVPTFQREIVWDRENVKKLWDSIYKFYPLGSILIWKTSIKLNDHREVGGHLIKPEDDRTEFQYILDGQQRTTSLLTSIYGGRIAGKPDFDPTLYIDLTIPVEDNVDDTSYNRRFLFWDEIDDKKGAYHRNMGKMNKFNEGLIIKLLEVKNNFQHTFSKLNTMPNNKIITDSLWTIKNVLDNYKMAFIELKGIEVDQVCQIFERINQAGRPLDIFDIVVAKTYRLSTEEKDGFYLRHLTESFRNDSNGSKFLKIDDIDYLQILSILIRENIDDSGIYNITPRYLNDIKAEQIEAIWPDGKKAILKVFDFFENHLNIKAPDLVPFRYFYITFASYFFNNNNPDYSLLKKYFWYFSFHNEELLSNTTDLSNHIAFLQNTKDKDEVSFDRFLIDKDKLRKSSYSSKGRMSRAILSLYSNQLPKDWKFTDRNVIADNFFFTTDKPNLHHVFPTNFILQNAENNSLNSNSLMNIIYLTQITNLEISDKNPLKYIKDYDLPKEHNEERSEFERVLDSHLLNDDILKWSRVETMPENALEIFIENRINSILDDLKSKLNGIEFQIIDTREIENKTTE